MRLASFSYAGRNRVGFVAQSGALIDLADALAATGQSSQPCPADMIALIESWPALSRAVAIAIERVNENQHLVAAHDASAIAWLPPVLRPTKICCVALNNAGLDAIKISAPKHPAFFIKPSTALVGHGQPIELRSYYGIVHPEPELAVIIGKRTRDVSVEQAAAAVFGYSVHNDVTSVGMRMEDSFHFRFGRPRPDGSTEMIDGHTSYAGRYKGSDTFAALGPWIVTKDEIADPHALRVTCSVAGEPAMDDNTRNLNHSVVQVISFISQYQTLLPGDVISMGTAMHPGGETRRPLTAFDMNRLGGPVSVTIEAVGTITNPVTRS